MSENNMQETRADDNKKQGVYLDVVINGLTFRLRDESSTEHLQQVADLVNSRFDEIRENSPGYSLSKASVLVALQLAEELIRVQDELDAFLEETELTIS